MGLYYEEFEEGRTFTTPARAVTEADVRAFADLSGDRNPIHLDTRAAKRAGFDAPVAHGVLGLAAATGLVSQLGLTGGTLIALVGVTWRFRAPVRYGDEVSLTLRVAARRETRQGDRGLVTLAAELRNQRGEVVQEGEFIEMIRRHGPPGDSP